MRPALLPQPCRVPARTRTVGTRVAVRTASKDIQCQLYYRSYYSVACQTDPTIPEVKVDLARTGASCETCCQFFFKKNSADRHWRIQHSTEPPKGAQELYCCPYCTFSTYIRKYAQDHEGIHVPAAFSLRLPTARNSRQDSGLVVHAVKPSNERLNMCRFCKKYFASKQHRIAHEKRHDRRVSYACDLCPQSFTCKSKLDLHRKSHTDQPQHVCPVCHRSFNRKQGLACHVKHQVCKRNFECSVCQRCFSLREDLIAHAKVHKEGKPFVCDVCHRRFPQLGHLITHRKTHEQDVANPYSCNVCQRTFAEVSHLITHKRIHGARL